MGRQFLWRGGSRGAWSLGKRTYLMGVVNVTPDSFSDGGLWLEPEAALAGAQAMVESGADTLDFGAESTRPGHQPITVEEEWRRLAPVLEVCRAAFSLPLSVDTRKPEIARRALRAGADIINDIEGFQDPDMLAAVADSGSGVVLMFNRRPIYPEGMVDIDAMLRFFEDRLAEFAAAGIGSERVLVDPGLGFGYGVEDNWTVLQDLPRFVGLGAGLLLGPSRKRFIGAVTGLQAADRDVATAACCALAVPCGVDVVRIHNVPLARQAVAVADRWHRR